MVTVRAVIAKAAEANLFDRTVDRAISTLRQDPVVVKLIKKSGLRKSDAKLLLGWAALTGAEALLQELKKDLPWE